MDDTYNQAPDPTLETGIPKEVTSRYPSNVIGEIVGYQKHFYCPKTSRKERHMGNSDNNHPTVKPVDLMRYLVRLVTVKGGLVLDPFNGSGSTGIAAKMEGMSYVGIDLDQRYIDISQKRIESVETGVEEFME